MNFYLRLFIVNILLIIFAIFAFCYTDKVHAASFSLRSPNRVNADRVSGGTDNIGYNNSTWWDNAFYEGARNIGPWANGIVYKQQSYQWDNYGLCSGKSMLIEGQVGGLFDFFNQAWTIDVYNSGAQMTCYFARTDSSRMNYSCSGVGGGNLIINVSYGYPQNAYNIGVSKNVNITCDATQSDIENSINSLNTSINNQIQNDNLNTNNILNGNYQNTQQIISNNNNNTNSINSSINNLNNNITSDNVNGNNSSSSINSIKSTFNSENDWLLNIMLIPYTFFNSILSVYSNSCTDVNLGTIYNYNLTLPCVNLNSILGNVWTTIIDVILAGIMSFAFRKRLHLFFTSVLRLDRKSIDYGKVEMLS